MSKHLHVTTGSLPSSDDARVRVVIGRADRLRDPAVVAAAGVDEATWEAMVEATKPGDGGARAETWVGGAKVVMGVLPEVCSRHNSPSRAWAIPSLAGAACGAADAVLVLALDHADYARAACIAAARALPVYDRSTGDDRSQRIEIVALGPDGPIDDPQLAVLIDSVRLAASLFDRPPDDLNTTEFVRVAQGIAEETGANLTLIQGTDLRDQGFGGLWGVGRAATHKPALVALEYAPAEPTARVAWVGKGIVYDTGGLSIKGKTGMPGMKGDMGGAAAVLGAFRAAALAQVDYAVTAILCLAENAVGPDSIRPDDVLEMRSGRTVEVNNTDAEGRLVLADGVAWACEQGPLDLLVDVATLTGAALVATGKVHAALYCNDAEVEAHAVVVGRAIGEPCHPLPFAPELFRKEFKSAVADMKNSVKDRANAQSSCAGQFVGNHLPEEAPRWLHIDIAGPAWGANGRGTGFGVGLLFALGAAQP